MNIKILEWMKNLLAILIVNQLQSMTKLASSCSIKLRNILILFFGRIFSDFSRQMKSSKIEAAANAVISPLS